MTKYKCKLCGAVKGCRKSIREHIKTHKHKEGISWGKTGPFMSERRDGLSTKYHKIKDGTDSNR